MFLEALKNISTIIRTADLLADTYYLGFPIKKQEGYLVKRRV
jgi:hypothetical protein